MGRSIDASSFIVRLLGAVLCMSVVFGWGLTSASAKETIKLGFIGPLSGGNALQGIGAKNGFLLAVKQANEDDYPYKVVPVALDDASQPSVGVSAALKLVNDPKVVAAIGHWNSPVALATTPIFNRHQMPFIVWGAISPKITEQNYFYVTRDTPTLAQENEPLADWVVKDLGYHRISILSTTDDYGEEDIKAFKKYATQNGAEIVSVDAVPPDTTNFKPVLSKIKQLKPDLVYFGGVIAPGALARKQMESIGLDVPLAGISGIYDQKYLDIAGKAADGTLASEPVVQENPKLKAFYSAYAAEKFDNPAGPYGKYAYDATNILLKVIREHGIKDSHALAQAIRNIRYDGVLGVTTFDKNGQTQVPITTEHYVVQDGKWVLYSKSRYAKAGAAKND